MDNLKTATKFFLSPREIYIRITFYNEQNISKNPAKIPENRPRVRTHPPLPPPNQSKHGFVPRSLARFQAANKQRNNSARRGGWFLETRAQEAASRVARPVTSSFVAAMTPESLESTRPFGQPFTLTRMIASRRVPIRSESSILCVPFQKKGYISSFCYSIPFVIRHTNENFENQSYLIEFSQIRFDSSWFSGESVVSTRKFYGRDRDWFFMRSGILFL